jgi:hypothetical protein
MAMRGDCFAKNARSDMGVERSQRHEGRALRNGDTANNLSIKKRRI